MRECLMALIIQFCFSSMRFVFCFACNFLKGTAAATGFALAISLANIAGMVSNTLIGITIHLTGSAHGALWIFAGFLALSCCLVGLLPARIVNR